jgi:hypothetical protein
MIRSFRESANDAGGLSFWTQATGGSNSERMSINSSGKVGIGKSTPNAKLHVDDSGGGNVFITRTSTNEGIYFEADGTNGTVRSTSSTGSLLFQTNGNNERMRINSSGKLLINTTSAISGSSAYLHLKNNYTNTGMSLQSNNTAPHHSITFHNPNGQVGQINTDGSGVTFTSNSDYRLKENVNYDFDATSRLKQLKPARFNFIADADKTVDGFLAHEVQSVVPEAITGEKDAVDDDGNPKYQGIDQSKLVPLLVKTIQELEARITTLEANNP